MCGFLQGEGKSLNNGTALAGSAWLYIFPEAKRNNFSSTDFLGFVETFGEEAPKKRLGFMPMCVVRKTKSL